MRTSALPADSRTRRLIESARPKSRHGFLLRSEGLEGGLVFLTAHSRLEHVGAEDWESMEEAWINGQDEFLERWSTRPKFAVPSAPPPRLLAISLAVAQKCNLGCTYCYARQGEFGGPARTMSLKTAQAAIDRLLQDASPGDTATVAFMGGEPLINRPVIQAATKYACEKGALAGVNVNFSITTNGTLLVPVDAEFFERHGFAVTISLDGIGEVHDQLRPTRGGSGTFDRIMRNVRVLLDAQRHMQVSCRVTVTPSNLCLWEALEAFISVGFHSVGFSPLLSAPNGQDEMGAADLERMLAEMVRCGLSFERAVCEGRRYPFLNMVNAMKEIHAGTCRPLPCGAGASYLGVGADGSLAACHRFVNDPVGAMGSLAGGLDIEAQSTWLHDRYVDRQEPCRDCWARYLCGGGCHHEVIHRGRASCDFIRGWLHYCLQAYSRLHQQRPDYFGFPECNASISSP